MQKLLNIILCIHIDILENYITSLSQFQLVIEFLKYIHFEPTILKLFIYQ